MVIEVYNEDIAIAIQAHGQWIMETDCTRRSIPRDGRCVRASIDEMLNPIIIVVCHVQADVQGDKDSNRIIEHIGR